MVIPLSSYIEGTILTNFFYYLPQTTKHAVNFYQSPIQTVLYAAFYPAIVFFLPFKTFFIIYRLVAIQLLIIISLLIASRKFAQVMLLLIALTLTNLRPAAGFHDFYQAFHALPYFSLIIGMITAYFYPQLMRLSRFWQKGVFALPMIIIFLILIVDKSIYFRQNSKEADLAYISFAEIYTFSDTIKKLSNPSNTLAVMPFEELLYWYPHLPSATRFLFYDEVVNEIPRFVEEIRTSFATKPPTFVYRQLYYLEPWLSTNDYLSLPRNTATYSGLYIRKDKVESITTTQWESIKVHGFKVPENK